MFGPTDQPLPGCERHCGIVVTSQMNGPFVGAIYVPNHDGKVYLMPQRLFEFDLKLGTAHNLSISKMQKMEEMFLFGDWLTFDANSKRIVEQIVAPAQQLCIPKAFGLVLTVKTVAVVSKDGNIWTSKFGVIPHQGTVHLPINDVPVEAYVKCDYDVGKPFEISFGLFTFGEVDIDNREAVKHAPWNQAFKLAQLPCYSDSDDDVGSQLTENRHAGKTDLNRTEISYNMKGIVFPDFINAVDHPNEEFVRAFKHDVKRENNMDYAVPGNMVRFDAYYSDIHERWIAFNYLIVPLDVEKKKADDDVEKDNAVIPRGRRRAATVSHTVSKENWNKVDGSRVTR